MKKLILSLVALAIGIGQLFASEKIDLLNETFQNVNGSMEATDVLDQSQLDNPSGWTFTNAYAGPQCVIIKKGGSVTTPPIPELTGNALFYFGASPWEDPSGQTLPPDWEKMTPHALALIGNGELSINEYDTRNGITTYGGGEAIYNVDATTRITLTASYDIILSNVCINYAGNAEADAFAQDFTGFSHESGEYYNPFDLTLTKSSSTIAHDDGSHNILVFTLDGTDPIRTSPRYDGSPIHITSTTTVKTATIFGDGYMFHDKPRVYTFPTAETPEIPVNTFELTVSKPGNLKSQLLDLDADVIEGLILKGKINGADLKYIIDAQGRTAKLTYLDMSELTFEYDGTEYVTAVSAPEAGMGTTYISHYYLSEQNSDELIGATPTSKTYNHYRNNLESAFTESNIKRIVVPKILTSIGAAAFSGVSMATIPDGVEEIGAYAFCDCVFVNLPSSIKKIGDGAFGENLLMKSIDLPNLEYIGDGAFHFSKISSFNFTDKLTYIGNGAFAGTMLTEAVLTMPGDTIPENIFAHCKDLKKVVIGGDAKVLGKSAFENCENISEFSLPQTIEEVGTNSIPDYLLDTPEDGIVYFGKAAYKRTEDKTEYIIKPGTVSLTDELFSYSPIAKITLPASVKKIGNAAFMHTQLTSTPEMPGVERIGENAFAECQNLARVTIPERVTYIGSCAFLGCNALWSVTYNAIDAECDGRLSPRDLERIVIGDKVRRVPAGLYTSNTNVTEVILPQSVEILDPEVFEGCVNLEYVHLSDNITTISDNTFNGCSSLRDIHWPARLKNVGASAFRDCKSLKTISLPEGMESVGYNAFGYCHGVEKLYIASTISAFDYGCFTFDNADTPVTITATAATPQEYNWNWHYIGPATIKVPAASLAAYKADPNWNGSNNGKTNQIIAIEGISAPNENTEISFNTGIDNETDLRDTVIGDIYVTIGEEDGYDETDGSIVLNSSMAEEYVEAVGGMVPGASDIANRFNGLVVQLPVGQGKITLNCLTVGTKRASVKIGDTAPMYYTKGSKGDISIDYNVSEDTYVYIYASETEAEQQSIRRSRASVPTNGNCVKIYSIGVSPISSGINGIADDNNEFSPIVEYYSIDGTRVDSPVTPGIYIGRRTDGSSIKILIK